MAIFTVLSSWLRAIARVHLVYPQTKPIDLGCESVGRQLPSTSTIAILLILSQRWYSF